MFAREEDASNTNDNPGGKLVGEISVIGTLLVKKVPARKKCCPKTNGTPVYNKGIVDWSNNTVSPNEKVKV